MSGYECWVWIVTEDDGREGPVAEVIPGGILAPLMSRKKDLALRFQPLAEAHAKQVGRPVRLAHMVETQ